MQVHCGIYLAVFWHLKTCWEVLIKWLSCDLISYEMVSCLSTHLSHVPYLLFNWPIGVVKFGINNMPTYATPPHKRNSITLVREQTIRNGQPPLVSEVSGNFYGLEGCHVVSAMDPHGLILGFLDRNHYFFFQVAPQLYSWGWVGPVPDPVLLRKSGSARNSDQ
jgi:hypothetical protein